jgi:hypothetical protein
LASRYLYALITDIVLIGLATIAQDRVLNYALTSHLLRPS